MNNLRLKGMSSDGTKSQCSDAEIQALGHVFFYTIDELKHTDAESAWFNVSEFEELDTAQIADFDLRVTRERKGEKINWKGEFTHGDKNLTIYVETSC